MQNFTSPKKYMHKNAKKLFGVVWEVKNCAPFTINVALFWWEKIVHLFVLFLAKKCAPLSSKLLKTLVSEVAKFKRKKKNTGER